MENYRVNIKETKVYIVDVEADNEEDAINKGRKLIESDYGKCLYCNDSYYQAWTDEE